MIVEDNRADIFLIRESMRSANVDAEIVTVQDGEKAVRVFEEADRNPSAPCPALVILDINLPKKPGSEVLQSLRNSRRCSRASVLVVTSSNSEEDRQEMAKLGAKDYFRKPSAYGEFMKLGNLVKKLLEQAGGHETGEAS
ncbi:MAG TPA: response regulator [Bryobacteraceae bacterium]|nr:response regulator [Bryobacteraceae bacterium]